MCVVAIVDANSLSLLVARHGQPDDLLLGWLRKRYGTLAFSGSGQYSLEIRKNSRKMELFKTYDQGGQLKKITASELASADRELGGKNTRSNDVHILSLALASGATVLCSNDADLGSDFKDKTILPSMGRRPRGVYPMNSDRKQRRDFLDRRRCPARK